MARVFDYDDYGSMEVLFHPVAWMPVMAFVVTLVFVEFVAVDDATIEQTCCR